MTLQHVQHIVVVSPNLEYTRYRSQANSFNIICPKNISKYAQTIISTEIYTELYRIKP